MGMRDPAASDKLGPHSLFLSPKRFRRAPCLTYVNVSILVRLKLACGGGAVGEISMAYFHQTNSPERTAQIDTIGWVFVLFVVAVTSITGIALYVSLSQ